MVINFILSTWVGLTITTKVGDSIKEVCCNVTVKLSGNIMVHALVDDFSICYIWDKVLSDFIIV